MELLKDIRVLDLTTMVSGPVAATILADQGADVIKVEPLHGEQMRHVRSSHFGVNPMFFSCNRGKKSISLNLKSEQGKEVLWRLIETADVLIQNFRPGAIEKMGFSAEKVREKNKSLIFVSISGFGEEGPYAQKRVYDPVIQALSGAADIQGDHKTGEPHLFKLIIADKITSLTTSQAISSALYSREKTGEGQHVKISMLDSMLSFFWPEGMTGLTYDEYEVDSSKSMSAVEPIFATKDGHVTAVSIADSEWAGMCRAFGRSELIEDPRFINAIERFNHAEIRKQIVAEEIAKWTSEEILARLDAEDVPCAPILKRDELKDHPQIQTNGSIHTFNVPGYGNINQARPPAQFEQAPFDGMDLAPELGEHTASLLEELGYSKEEIDQLSEGRAVRLAE
ncbi:CaiB/BaiF CoA transferase family protein [Sneathiella aquimaris]|uniref:CaiB/BaiF CoA transferase family protein n=1 Tax=Sneathiella aquimaris TaxID=2599305 RepID=UPI001C68686E|nr:CoA transferase [Sneathiella aquimaris]